MWGGGKRKKERDQCIIWYAQPILSQTYGLQPGGFHTNKRNHDNDEDTSDSHEQGSSAGQAGITETTDMTKTAGAGVQKAGYPKNGFGKIQHWTHLKLWLGGPSYQRDAKNFLLIGCLLIVC